MSKVISEADRIAALLAITKGSLQLVDEMKEASDVDPDDVNEEILTALRILFSSTAMLAASVGALACQMLDSIQDAIPDRQTEPSKTTSKIIDGDYTPIHKDEILMKAKRSKKK